MAAWDTKKILETSSGPAHGIKQYGEGFLLLWHVEWPLDFGGCEMSSIHGVFGVYILFNAKNVDFEPPKNIANNIEKTPTTDDTYISIQSISITSWVSTVSTSKQIGSHFIRPAFMAPKSSRTMVSFGGNVGWMNGNQHNGLDGWNVKWMNSEK